MENDLNQQPADVNNSVPFHPPEPTQADQSPKPKRRKLVWWIAGGILVLLLAAGAAYWFVLRDSSKPAASETASTEEQTEQPPAPDPADPTPTQYKSAKLNVEFTHRKDWKVKESGSGEVTITSPQISYVGADGQAGLGVFTVKLRKGVPEAMKATIEKAVAARASEVIAYAEPTAEQRQYTNLSYGGTKEAFNFFIVTGNTELKPGNAFAYALPLDSTFYLIAGGYGTDSANSLSFDSVPVESMDSEALTQAIDLVESLKIY